MNEMKKLIDLIKEKGFDEDEVCQLTISEHYLHFECGGILENTRVNKNIKYCPFCGKEIIYE